MIRLEHRRAQNAWRPNARVAKRLAGKKQEAEIMEVAEAFCSTWAPIAKKTEDAVIPFVCESITTWGDMASLSKENIYATSSCGSTSSATSTTPTCCPLSV